jgi:hypothetical protein
VTAAWLWQADGPLMGTRGVAGDSGRARRLAAECLLSGTADSAVVEEAATGGVGAQTLAGGYPRSGRKWRATVGARGRVRWVAVTAA